MNTQKTTLATVKKFIRENSTNLYANCKSSFDGMTDCVESRNDGFSKVDPSKIDFKNASTLGIEKLWFVGCSRDYFTAYNESGLCGYSISNSCGRSIIATKI